MNFVAIFVCMNGLVFLGFTVSQRAYHQILLNTNISLLGHGVDLFHVFAARLSRFSIRAYVTNAKRLLAKGF